MDSKMIKKYTKNLEVLIVDDESIIIDSVGLTLRRYFKKVHTASDGIDAFETWEREKSSIDLIISDISMPRLNGIGLVERLKESGSKARIIMVSAHSEVEYFLELINLGVDGFILKPIDIKQFLTQIYKISKIVFEERMLDSYQNDLEQILSDFVSQSVKLKKLQIVLKNVAYYMEEKQVESVLEFCKAQNSDCSLLLRYYSEITGREIGDGDSIKEETLLSKIAPTKEIVSRNRLSALEYLEQIEYDKYFSDVSEELSLLGEIAIDLYESLEFLEISRDSIVQIGYLFSKYASTILKFSEFSILANSVEEMGHFFSNVDTKELLARIDEQSFRKMMLFFITDLERWKSAVFIDKNAVDVHYLDDQSQSICKEVLSLLDDEECDSGDNIILF